MTGSAILESLGAVMENAARLRVVPLSPDDVALLIEALDAHEYWQVGDGLPRHDGLVWIPGDSVDDYDRFWTDGEPTPDEVDAIRQVRRCRELAERLRDASTSW